MLMNQTQHSYESNIDSPVHASQIKATPSMFKILSDQLYTDKVLAILRELVANAWDAHVAAGNQSKPIDIHLPTALEPWFEVKDYGTGLPADGVVDLYMNYGASDKQNTNDLIGGFGIGSKSPYAYTDQFSVESRSENKRYQFQAFIQEDGTPGCVQLNECDTTEPNGLTIRVNVASERSFMEFEAAAEKILPYLPTTPNINKNLDLEQTEATVDLTPNDPVITRVIAREARMGRTFKVVQGIIPYNAKEAAQEMRESITPRISSDPHTKKLWRIETKFSIECHTSVGVLEVAASRENLSLTRSTIDDAGAIYKRCLEYILKEMENRIEKQSTWFARAEAAKILDIEFNPPSNIQQYLSSRTNYSLSIRAITDHTGNLFCRNYRKKEGYSSNVKTELDLDMLNRLDCILVAKKPSSIFHPYLQDTIFQDRNNTNVIKLNGDINHIKKVFSNLGLNIPIKEIPYIKPTKRGSTGNLGKTEYVVNKYKKIDGKIATSSFNITASEFLNEEIDPAKTTVFVCSSVGPQHWFNTLYNYDLLKMDKDEFIFIEVKSGHTKVIQTLLNQGDHFINFDLPMSKIDWPSYTDLNAISISKANLDIEERIRANPIITPGIRRQAKELSSVCPETAEIVEFFNEIHELEYNLNKDRKKDHIRMQLDINNVTSDKATIDNFKLKEARLEVLVKSLEAKCPPLARLFRPLDDDCSLARQEAAINTLIELSQQAISNNTQP